MPSAHGPIFCHKELREKVGMKVRLFLGLSQRTRLFVASSSEKKSDRFFLGPKVSTHGPWQYSRLGLIVGWSNWFFIGLKSAHKDWFFVVSSSEKRSERCYIGAKVSAHETIFTPIFCFKTKNRSVCTGHNYWPKIIHISLIFICLKM